MFLFETEVTDDLTTYHGVSRVMSSLCRSLCGLRLASHVTLYEGRRPGEPSFSSRKVGLSQDGRTLLPTAYGSTEQKASGDLSARAEP
jgi:hypothetical protein